MSIDLGPSDPVSPMDQVGPPDPVSLVDLIAAAVQACPAVAGLHGGRFGQTTTYLPGRRVAGVAVLPGEIVIGVVGRYPASISEMATQVRAAVAAVAPGTPVTVHVEDLTLPDEDLTASDEDRADPTTKPPTGSTAVGRSVNSLPPRRSPPVAPQPDLRPEQTAPLPTPAPLATPLSRPLE